MRGYQEDDADSDFALYTAVKPETKQEASTSSSSSQALYIPPTKYINPGQGNKDRQTGMRRQSKAPSSLVTNAGPPDISFHVQLAFHNWFPPLNKQTGWESTPFGYTVKLDNHGDPLSIYELTNIPLDLVKPLHRIRWLCG